MRVRLKVVVGGAEKNLEVGWMTLDEELDTPAAVKLVEELNQRGFEAEMPGKIRRTDAEFPHDLYCDTKHACRRCGSPLHLVVHEGTWMRLFCARQRCARAGRVVHIRDAFEAEQVAFDEYAARRTSQEEADRGAALERALREHLDAFVTEMDDAPVRTIDRRLRLVAEEAARFAASWRPG